MAAERKGERSVRGLVQRRVDAVDTARRTQAPSLLWPPGASRATIPLSPAVVADLALDPLVRKLDIRGGYESSIRSILSELCVEPAAIAYRQDVLGDLLNAPELSVGLQSLLPQLAALGRPIGPSWGGDSPLMAVLARLEELDRYVSCIDKLRSLLDSATASRSDGLRDLRLWVRELADDPDVAALRAELPTLHELVAETMSVSIGLNLGHDLKPTSVTIVELSREQFKGPRSLLGRLLPGATTDGRHGTTPLREVGPVALRRESRLYKDLVGLLEAATAPLATGLARYRDVHAGPLASLERELAFLTGAAILLARVRAAGVPVCRPEIAPAAERSFAITDSANLVLALHQLDGDLSAGLAGRLVRNDAVFPEGVRTLLVTGPNRGGKTTYCRAIGQAQVLFQCGLHVPGSAARVSPVDGLWTHFPLAETERPGGGRLDEEVQRLRRIFAGATAGSLVLLNEPLTSTSERDALAIAVDTVRALQLLGARVVLVTHLHDLALAIPELNQSCPPGCGIQSLAAETIEESTGVRSTFRIVPGAPGGRSHAREVARQHGLTFDQIKALLDDRSAAEQ